MKAPDPELLLFRSSAGVFRTPAGAQPNLRRSPPEPFRSSGKISGILKAPGPEFLLFSELRSPVGASGGVPEQLRRSFGEKLRRIFFAGFFCRSFGSFTHFSRSFTPFPELRRSSSRSSDGAAIEALTPGRGLRRSSVDSAGRSSGAGTPPEPSELGGLRRSSGDSAGAPAESPELRWDL